jgi:succinate-semialdehyde dehydrogenase/glutarate-semialdehyde dehydrogenase
VNLTGSTQVGIEIAKSCAQHLHRVHLELGGNDALVILPGADPAQAAQEAFASRIGNSGQVCCAGKRFLVQDAEKDAFLAALQKLLEGVVVGDPTDPKTTCGPLISEKAAIELETHIAHTLSQGGRLLFGGRRLGGAYFEPTILDLPPDADAAQDLELFGPVWSILTYHTAEEAVALANHTHYGLSSGVIGGDMPAMLHAALALEAGTCVVGGSGAYRTSDQPFGGYKMSGIGREGGRYTLEELSQVKTIVLKVSG